MRSSMGDLARQGAAGGTVEPGEASGCLKAGDPDYHLALSGLGMGEAVGAIRTWHARAS
jgi:hypothetical protein